LYERSFSARIPPVLFQSDTELAYPSRLLAIAVFLAVVGATLSAVVRNRPSGEWERTRLSDLEASTEPLEREPMALAWIDAVPWGHIERITSRTGEVFRVPSPAETPVMLELPAGDWIVTLSNPDSEEDQQCELSLAVGVSDSCRVEFERLSVDDYFRDAGWWR